MARQPHEFVEEMAHINPDIELVGTYTKATNHIDVRCKLCGKEWSPKACSLLRGKGCPHCSAISGAKRNSGYTRTKTTSEFKNQLQTVNKDIEILSDYVSRKNPVHCHCLRCGFYWNARPYSLLDGHGCPHCAKTGTSFMEQFILKSFSAILGSENVLSRDKSLIQMELDIYIPCLKLAFEPGDWYLHKSSLYRDSKKREKCAQCNVRLITIYDNYPSNAKPPFSSDCIVFSGDYSRADHQYIKELVLFLMKEANLYCSFTDINWEKIESQAYEDSLIVTHEKFVHQLQLVNPTIQICSEYKGSSSKIKVKCIKCSYEWESEPARLLSGDGCRKCGTIRAHQRTLRPQSDFLHELEVINPNVTVIGIYKGRHHPIAAKCKICGFEWEPTAGSLLRGSNHKGSRTIHRTLKTSPP